MFLYLILFYLLSFLMVIFFLLCLNFFIQPYFFFFLEIFFKYNDFLFLFNFDFFIYIFIEIFYFIIYILYSILKILFIFISVAFFTVAERKILGAIHRRRGPNLVGFWGLLQPIADALKLFLKELLLPVKANSFIFFAAPIWILILSVFSWVFIPFNSLFFVETSLFFHSFFYVSTYILFPTEFFFSYFLSLFCLDLNNAILFLLAISSLNVYGIILSGWASNSKYSFLGGLRSAAQMISYEVSFGLTIIPVILLSGSFNFFDIVYFQQQTTWFCFSLLPSFFIFLVSILAETNRTPFDLPEAEAELVAGYNVEYSAITFAMFFLGEYSSMLVMGAIVSLLFLGGWNFSFFFVFSLKLLLLCLFYVNVRATVPRYRYDQLMQICWKNILPVSISFLLYTISLIFVFFTF